MATRDIKVGDCDTGSDTGGDIVICHDRTNPEGREIRVCVDCTNLTELGLAGEDAPSVGDQYTVSGGVAPFSWSFDGGGIDNTGLITSITACGGGGGDGAVGSVSVTDACGQHESIIVRLPGGVWGNQTLHYNLIWYGVTVRSCVDVEASTRTQHLFWCSGGSTYPTQDSAGDPVPPINSECATALCAALMPVAWQLTTWDWVCA